MNFLLDTNVVSEWVKPRPNANVVRWLAETDEDRVFLSVITFAEIRLGVEEIVAGWRRDGLTRWLQVELPARFEGRILGVDLAVAEGWGRLDGTRQQDRSQSKCYGCVLCCYGRGPWAHVGYAEYDSLRKIGC